MSVILQPSFSLSIIYIHSLGQIALTLQHLHLVQLAAYQAVQEGTYAVILGGHSAGMTYPLMMRMSSLLEKKSGPVFGKKASCTPLDVSV